VAGAGLVPAFAHRLRKMQSGRATDYLAWLVVGTAVLVVALVLGERLSAL
jgi:hypothetical protein